MKNILIFIAGSAVGSVITWKLIEKYYKDLADQEIESVVETFKNRKKEDKNIEENSKTNKEQNKIDDKVAKNNKDKAIQESLIKSLNYGETTIDEVEEKIINESPIDTASILIIDPNEYGDEEKYEIKSWMYWHDGILTNEYDEIVEDPTSIVGDALSHFGEYEVDSVYVRNRAIEADIEILLSEKDFNA